MEEAAEAAEEAVGTAIAIEAVVVGVGEALIADVVVEAATDEEEAPAAAEEGSRRVAWTLFVEDVAMQAT